MTGLAQRLTDLAAGAVLDTARVTGVEHLPEQFVRVRITAEAFHNATWVPGAKVQLRPRRGTMRLRTYTPVGWDPTAGTTDLIAYTHGDGPGAAWFREVTTGAACELLGPRRSLDLSAPAGPVLFVGDESSVALACALRTVTTDVTHIFEAAHPAALPAVLAQLGLPGAAVVAKTPDRADLLRHAEDSAPAVPYTLIVTGDAATLHAVRRATRTWQRPPAHLKGKAYWAEGRTGLD